MTSHIKKTVKQALLGAMVLGLAIGASSWTKASNALNETWYYHGPDDLDEIVEASNYSKELPEQSCGFNETICEIEAPADPFDSTIPHMGANVGTGSETVASQITQARTSNFTQNETVQSFREL